MSIFLRKYLSPFAAVILIFILLFLPAYSFLKNQYQEKKRLHFDAKLENASLQFHAVQNAYALLAQNVFDNVINKEEIVSLVKRANGASREEQDALRQQLYVKLSPLYENLKKQNIRQLHFHLKNSVSFLRFHRPAKYGDSLEGIRFSIDKVNRTKKETSGFEEGRIFNGFRHVFPLVYENRFAGTVEISYSFNAIKIEEAKLYRAYYTFMLSKQIISKKVWKEEQSNYIPSILSDEYLHDKATISQKSEQGFSTELIANIDKSIASQAAQKVKTEKEFSLSTKVDDTYYLAMFTPIYNVENIHVAYYISYEKDSTLKIMEHTCRVEIIIAAISALILALMIVLYFLSQKRTHNALELLATTDPLTKIANRNKLNIILEKSMQLSIRYKLPLCVIFFDIDDFKKINDNLGHEAGDTILISIARIISEQLRASDTFARWGGEEFIIILPETEHHDAKKLAERYRKLIQEYKFLPELDHVTCSFGVTQLRSDDDETSLLKRVDNALYSAKSHGKNIVVDVS